MICVFTGMDIVECNELKVGIKLILAHPNNGYDDEKNKAWALIERYGPDPIFTIKDFEVGDSYTSISFEEIGGSWNSVQFKVKT